MTALQEIDHKLSLLPEYLRYRAEWKIEGHRLREEFWSNYDKLGIILAPYERHRLMTFDQWIAWDIEERKNKFHFRSEFMSPGFVLPNDYIPAISPLHND